MFSRFYTLCGQWWNKDDINVWRWRLLIVWIIVFTGAVAYSIHSTGQTTDRINESRVEITRANCDDQNDRNEQTTDLINRLTREDQQRGASVAAAERFRSRTLLILNALVPVRDCQALVEELFGK